MEAKGGEVRRVHVVYFLSRMGRIEHPHLIRVHHLNRTGVRLRDVKRWLSELRGKDMPDSFAWSYKRRYKTGYVWQDLLDDDLITPIADNEYVLKGSEISSFPFDLCARSEKTTPIQKPDPAEDESYHNEEIPDTKTDISCKPSQTDGQRDSSFRRTVEFKVEGGDEKGSEGVEEESEEVGVLDSSAKKEKSRRSSGSSFTRSKSHPAGASLVFRNLLSCGAVETNDSAMLPIDRRGKPSSKGEICKAERLCGSQKILGGAWNSDNLQQQNSRKSYSGMKGCKQTSDVDQKTVSSTFKPVAEPNCSQCGKAFKPEKLHTHMKSCKGLKSRIKSGGAEKLSQTAAKQEFPHAKEANPGLLLTH